MLLFSSSRCHIATLFNVSHNYYNHFTFIFIFINFYNMLCFSFTYFCKFCSRICYGRCSCSENLVLALTNHYHTIVITFSLQFSSFFLLEPLQSSRYWFSINTPDPTSRLVNITNKSKLKDTKPTSKVELMILVVCVNLQRILTDDKNKKNPKPNQTKMRKEPKPNQYNRTKEIKKECRYECDRCNKQK